MDKELTAGQLGLQSMIDLGVTSEPNAETTGALMIRRTLTGRAAIRTVEKAMEIVGGSSFYRSLGLERLYRDVQAARFPPLQERPQLLYTGRLALGLDING